MSKSFWMPNDHSRSWWGFALASITTVAASVSFLPASGCSSKETNPHPLPKQGSKVVTPPAYGQAYDKLSDWHLFQDGAKQTPSEKVTPYEVISPLFSDYTTKFRYLWLPENTQIDYSDTTAWDFPVGTILVKTFSYAADLSHPDDALKLLETRILWHEPDGWSVHTYQWNDAQTDAESVETSATIPSDFIDKNGNPVHNQYYIPNLNECKQCHTNTDVVGPNGLKSRQLDQTHDYGADGGVENQIDHFARIGAFMAAPTPAASRVALVDPFGDGPIDLRARAYLDANCSSCHTTGGSASQSALLLDYFATDPKNTDANWGVCKFPTSAGGAQCGNMFDVVPGKPEESIMICRVSSTEAKWRMPALGVQLVYAEGVSLLTDWISAMPPGVCSN